MSKKILFQSLLKFRDQIKDGTAKVQDIITDYFNQTGKSVTDEERAIILNEFAKDAPSNVVEDVFSKAEGIDSISLKDNLMKTDNPFSDLVKTTKKGPKSLRQRKKEAEEALKNKNVVPFKDPDKKAEGGRIGYKIGSIDKARRAFLKTMGAVGAGIGAVKSGILGLGEKAAPMVEAARETVTQAPSYFFDLVAKIKMLGKPGMSISERQNVTNYKNYELTEDVTTGDIRITKQKGDPDAPGYREEVMEYNKGGVPDEDVGITRESYDEATLFPDIDGKMKDIEDGIEPDSIQEIIEETIKDAPPIKKAGGGIATMLGE